jgi:hypothetical protein
LATEQDPAEVVIVCVPKDPAAAEQARFCVSVGPPAVAVKVLLKLQILF